MKKSHLSILLLLILLVGGSVYFVTRIAISSSANREPTQLTMRATTSQSEIVTTIDPVISLSAKRLINAYPEFLELDPTATNTIKWKKDNASMQFDDGAVGKSLEMMLNQPDLEDQMSMQYESGDTVTIRTDFDPGRVRVESFFEKMYGGSEAEVKANLETVYWLPHHGNQPLLVTRVNGVSQKLQAISDELDELVEQPGYEYLLPHLLNPGGTFKWRPVVDTDRLSPHSYGIAMDINTTNSDYWEWSKGGVAAYQNRIPMEIVKIFEKHGFIWGGKWYHYDTMHFEYRPELIGNL